MNELAGKVFEEGGPELYISRAQKKAERSREIKQKLDQLRGERITKFQGMNLYVKNIDDEVTDEQFREAFSAHGTITSAKIMRTDDNTSRGFGYVCYSSPEEATRAVNELNGKLLKGKPLVVTLHQRKDVRRAHLAATMGPRPRFSMGQGNVPFMPMYMNNPNMNMRPGPGGYPMMGGMMPRPPRGPMNGNYRQQQMPYGMPPYGMPNMQIPGGQMKRPGQMPPQVNQAMQMPQQAMQRQQPGRGPQPGRGLGRGQQGQMQGQTIQQPNGQAIRLNNNIKYNPNARNQPMGIPAQVPVAVNQTGSIDVMNFSNLSVPEQKNAIGERLYPLIYAHQPDLAGKITGMLLEMDNSELLHLLESPDALYSKIEEALQVLKAHQSE